MSAAASAPVSTSPVDRAVVLALEGKQGKGHSQLLASPDIKALAPGERGAAAWRLLGRSLMTRGHLEEAESAFREAERGRPNHPETALALAMILFNTDRAEAALEAARRAVTLAPLQVEAVLQLVRILLDMGRLGEAEAEARSFDERDRKLCEGRALRGLVLRSLGRLNEAEECFRAVVATHPTYVPALLGCAHTHNDLGRFDDAAALYRRVVAMTGLEDAAYGLVNTLASAGKMQEAATHYAQICRQRPGFNTRWPELLFPLRYLEPEAASARPLPQHGQSMVLAFVPFQLPAVPLAPALLKGFVETHSRHRVTALDLNASFFRAVQSAIGEGQTPFELPETAAFLNGGRFLSEDTPSFMDAAAYETAAAGFLAGASVLKTIYQRQCKQVQQSDGPLPWHIRSMAKALLASNPSIVGLSAMFDEQLAPLQALGRAVKALSPQTPVVMGGGALSKAGATKMLASGAADYVVLHDGEETLLSLLDALENNMPVAGICQRLADGTIWIEDDGLPTKQDRVPPADFSDFDLGAYFNPVPVLPMLTSRGCYWRRCTFCNHFASYAGSYKAQSVTRVVDEMQAHVERFGVRHFSLVDEMLSASRFKKIGEEILERGLDVRYYALAKPTADFDYETLDIMYRSGCRYILWGQESGNERMLSVMDKGNTVASSRETLQASAQAGLRNHLFLMVGYPTEGMDELSDTVRFLHQNAVAVDQTQSGPFVLERGTPLHSRPQDFGIARVFDRRGLGACQLVRFRAASGFQPEQAVVAEKTLRRNFFGHFNPFSRYLGDFRDHALIVYSNLARSEKQLDLPSPEMVMAKVDAALNEAGIGV